MRHPVVLVRNDAVLTCGRTPLEAFDRLEVTDYSAQATIAAQSFGGLRPITDAQVEDLVTAFDLPGNNARVRKRPSFPQE